MGTSAPTLTTVPDTLDVPIHDHCPSWCSPNHAGVSHGGHHAGEPHHALAGHVDRGPDARAVDVDLVQDNEHGNPRTVTAMCPSPRVRVSEDGARRLTLTPAEARSLARILIAAADRLEVHI